MSSSSKSRLFGFGKSSRKRFKKRTASAKRSRRVQLEPLEDRRLLALLGVNPGFPSSFANSTGTVNYTAGTQAFVADATPLLFLETATSVPKPVLPPSGFDLQLQVDNSGNLVGGVPGDDFVVSGSVDIDGDNIPDATGTLLTGEVIAFGFEDSLTTDVYDFRITATGGAFLTGGTLTGGGSFPAYFSGKDIGLRIDSEGSSFTGDFGVSFAGGNKSTFGPIDKLDQGDVGAIEIIKYVDKVVELPPEMHVVNFDVDSSGSAVSAGDTASNQFDGLTISATNGRTGATNAAMIFDSSAPTGGDVDLGTPNEAFGLDGTPGGTPAGPGVGTGGSSNDAALGNILIISEDGDAADPDDEAHGGTITFTFDDPNGVTINYLDLLDIDSNEAGGSVVTLNTISGTQTIAIPTAGNNSYQRLAIDVDDVTSLDVNFVSSGAVTELKFTKIREEKQWFDANTDAEAVDFELGEEVEFSYHVFNVGQVPLSLDEIIDDNATPGDSLDDFNPIPVEDGGFNVGDVNQNGFLDPETVDGNGDVIPGEEWIFTFTITPDTPGEYCNIATVFGTPVDGNGNPSGDQVSDDDPAKYNIIAPPDIDIEKLTNGVQADDPSEAVEIAPGDPVTWTYIVTNTGGTEIAKADVVVVDDNGTPGDPSDDFTPDFVGPDVGNDNILSPGEVWEYSFSTTAETLTSSGATGTFSFTGSSSLSGTAGNIRTFSSNGVSVNTSAFSRDSSGNWAEGYLGLFSSGLGVTDTGEGDGSSSRHRVDNIVRDNYVLFEFSENIVVDQAFLDSVVDDSDLSIWIGTIDGAFGNHQTLSDALLSGLDLNEVDNTTSGSARWANFNGGEVSGNILVLAASTADTTPDDEFKIRKVKFQQVITGIYGNKATVDVPGASDHDPSHYKNPAPEPPGVPNIDIEKTTNNVQADTPAEAVEIAPGDDVTWTYTVTNTGEVAFPFAEVVVLDDAGTPGNTGDDFAPDFVPTSDDGDGILSPGEVWTYTKTTTAETLTTSGASGTFVFDGSSGLDGTNGNIRTFTTNGISVNASAWSRTSSGQWDDAFLGIFSGGLGVTDSSEGDGSNGTHRVDNVGRLNYVLFEFSENVVVDQAFLDSVVGDSDLSVWIGTIDGAFDNHQTLSDALLNGLAVNEVNNTTNGSARWANFNGGEVSGNVLVLAASTADTTPDDKFKIRKVKFQQLEAGIYGNIGSVTAGTVGDSDPSHYKNPVVAPSAKIGNFVWDDLNRNGRQDHGEPGLAGVTVNLLNTSHEVIGTTTTDSHGNYEFTGLEAGDYVVKFVLLNDYVFTAKGQGADPDNGSNADPHTGKTDVIHLDAHECDDTIDAGMYQAAVDFMFEAEDYEWIDHPWRVYHSSSASGGKFIKAPNGSGSHYNSPPNNKKVMYQFDVESSGNYEISGLVKARNSKDNSVWIKVDNKPWVQWHMDVTDNFVWQNVTDGWDKDATNFHLEAGSHTMEIKVREDGTKLDKFMFSKLATSTTVIDIADAMRDRMDNGEAGNWIVEVDDDGNEFLTAATGTHYSQASSDVNDLLSIDFEVGVDGNYKMHALVNALNGGDNSFWVRIDGGEWVEWHLTVTDGAWEWQTVTNGSSHETVSFDLTAGVHTLDIKIREDGSKIDKVVITNDDGIDLNSIT